jgi:5'-nucleotidase
MSRRALVVLALAFLLPWRPAAAQDVAAGSDFTILVVNDDGYVAPGLRILVDSLVPIANVVVAAPRRQQSGTGHGVSFLDPIRVDLFGNQHGINWYAIDARPATVVALALASLMDSLPDLVISGINTGENVGATTFLSGTVAGARHAKFFGLPAISVSMGVGSTRDYALAAGFMRQLVETLRADGLVTPELYLNVNVPANSSTPIKGVRVVRQSLQAGTDGFDGRMSPRGQDYFWSTWSPALDDVEGTDLHAFEEGYITITPLTIDQTDQERMGEFTEFFNGDKWERP